MKLFATALLEAAVLAAFILLPLALVAATPGHLKRKINRAFHRRGF